MTAAFPPLDLGFLAWFALAPLFTAIARARRARHAFALGYLFGCVHWGWTVTWIGTTVVNWSHTEWGWAAWVLLTAIKSLWFGLFGALAWWISRKSAGASSAAATAAAWTLVEWLRTQTMVAMPWSLIGYTQWRCLPIIQIADLAGVYGVSLVLALTNAAIAESGKAFRRSGVRASGAPGVRTNAWTPRRPDWSRPLIAAAALAAAAVAYGEISLARHYAGRTIRVALMQPNIRSRRDAPDSSVHDLALFAQMAEAAAPDRPSLVVWPETIAPGDVVTDMTNRQVFSRIARHLSAWELVGTSHVDESGGEHNSAVLFDPSGALVDRYDKQWLVPFGEWIPLRNVLPLGDVFHFPQRDVVPGTRNEPIPAGVVRMAVLICYESVFPILPRTRSAEGANLLVNITNDSWAGRSSELAQHFAMTVLRAVETRRCAVSAATTGITGVIQPSGRYASVPPYVERVWMGEVSLLEGRSVYVRLGDWLVGLCSLGLLWALLRRDRPSTES